MPKVSIIVPVYGVEKYIERCARSLFEQTLDDIEYIFVDDCTRDESVTVLERIMQDYPGRKGNVHILHNKYNVGPAISRRNGFDVVTGEYVICCDSDDWMERGMYEKLYIKAVEGNYDVCICDYRMIGDNYTGDRVRSYYADEDYLTSLLRCRITGSMWNKMVRRELYLSCEFVWPTLSFSEDWACSCQIAMMAKTIGYVPDALYNYVRHTGSIVNGKTKEQVLKKQEYNIANNKLVEEELKRRGLWEKYKTVFTVSKLNVKNYIRPYVDDAKILKQWRLTYPGLGFYLMSSNTVTLRVRFAYICTFLGIYPMISHLLHNGART